ncbi:MAG: VWA domain-containing protein [Betaproteobacteria bacterium]|nr:VWA domain-containing protein [Betaproteobacteria bacterium]
MDAGLRRLGLLARLLGAQAPHLAWLDADGAHTLSHLDPQAWLLPRDAEASAQLARLAHAVAHRRFGLAPQARSGLHALQRALFGLIEDARVEQLLARDFPGLRPVWAAQHRVSADAAPGVEVLLQRLARALADPEFDERHPWVHAARARVKEAWGDARAMRALASRMGHELGQMRLGFDAREFRVRPSYRDDHACLWDSPAEQARELCLPAAAAQASPPPEPAVPGADAAPREPGERGAGPADARAPVACTLPEWDWRIRCHRPQWCSVREQRAAAAPGLARAGAAPSTARARAPAAMLLRRWEAQARPWRWRARTEGDRPEPRAVLDWLLARAGAAPAEPRLFRASERGRARGHLLVLLDCSASSGSGPGGTERFARARATALALLLQARAHGWSCALAGFSSDTRHHVGVWRVQDFGERPDPPELAARLEGLRAQGSTRLGAALRYGALRLREAPPASARRLLLISDAQARDVDVHDPRYLRADLRRAGRELAAAGIALDWYWPSYVK